jgi:hypothetical protein
MNALHALLPAFFALSGCVTPTDLPAGTWEFSPNTMRFDTEIGKSTSRDLLIRNNYNGYIDIQISRPIVSGACPDEPFELPSFTRLAPNTTVALRVTHSPTAWVDSEACLFQVKLVYQPDDGSSTTDERSLALVGRIRDVDNDGDGAFRGRDNDCNDSAADPLAPLVSPFRRETCNGYDDDCDGTIDDADINELDQYSNGAKKLFDDAGEVVLNDRGFPVTLVEGGVTLVEPYIVGQGTWFPDADGDSWPANVDPDYACRRPSGYTFAPCGVPGPEPFRECVACTGPSTPAGCVELSTVPDQGDNGEGWDCNDQSLQISPGSFDLVGDAIDRNCDTFVTCFADLDNDGWGDSFTLASVDPTTDDPYCRGGDVSATPGDCNDLDEGISPGAIEQCDGGAMVDEDCDLLVNDADPVVSPGTLVRYYPDDDADTYGNPLGRITVCEAPTGFVLDSRDCDDTTPAINPAGIEICDSLDNNCDSIIDLDAVDKSAFFIDRDGDGFGAVEAATDTALQALACGSPPLGYSLTADDCSDVNAEVRPYRSEDVANGLDDNCDGYERCYIDADQDDYGSDVGGATIYVVYDPTLSDSCLVNYDHQCTTSPSVPPTGTCTVSSIEGDCQDGDPLTYPGATELCGFGDNDCDGRPDESDPDLDADQTYYRDVDGDTFGDLFNSIRACDVPPAGYVADSTDCNDLVRAINPAATEIPGDGVDQNCDSYELCWPDLDLDGYGDLAAAEVQSNDGDILCAEPGFSLTIRRFDCDDTVATINPGTVESCDGDRFVRGGVDEDCNGLADDQDRDPVGVIPWYPDQDGDTYGSTTTVLACDQPPGFVIRSGDCNDALVSVNPAGTEVCDGIDNDCNGAADDDDVGILYGTGVGDQVFYRDNDGDGFGVAATAFRACRRPEGASSVAGDCDDANPDVKPAGVVDTIADGVDQDCDGFDRCYVDTDGDGWGSRLPTTGPLPGGTVIFPCQSPGVADNAEDCDDTRAVVAPDEIEVCDGLDNDCDRRVDDDDDDVQPPRLPAYTFRPDRDGDGVGDERAFVYACLVPPGYQPDSAGLDCDDLSPLVKPGAAEITADGIDQNCDRQEQCYVDSDGDRHGRAVGTTTSLDLACGTLGAAPISDDCDDTPGAGATIYPGAAERCSPVGTDEDCDGLVDDADAPLLDPTLMFLDRDADGAGGQTFTAFRCQPSVLYVTNDDDCDDNNDDVRPPSATLGAGTETCNGLDDDCDNFIDDADIDTIPTGRSTFYGDTDFDGFGDIGTAYLACDARPGDVRDSRDCDDGDPSVRPGAVEGIADGVDSNCDGKEVCYCDKDLDGFGSGQTIRIDDTPAFDDCEAYVAPPGPQAVTCDDPTAGAAVAQGDCNDDDPGTGLQASPFFLDNDGDGSGNPAVVIVTCTPPSGQWVGNSDDCDDTDFDVRPASSPFGDGDEVCNRKDDNCDGATDDQDVDDLILDIAAGSGTSFYADVDFDSFGDDGTVVEACEAPFGFVRNDADCDDTDPSVRPGVPELVGDDVDQDCDGTEDCFCNKDGDQFGDDDEPLTSVPMGPGPECAPSGVPAGSCTTTAVARRGGDCDDSDATTGSDPKLWYFDQDGDGFGNNLVFVLQCQPPSPAAQWPGSGGDCNDADVGINPSATEVCDPANTDENCNGVADDQDGLVDPTTKTLIVYTDIDRDGFGDDATAESACDVAFNQTLVNGDCDDRDPFRFDGAPETTADGVDNDCDTFEACYCDKDRDGSGVAETILIADVAGTNDCNLYVPPPGGTVPALTCSVSDRPGAAASVGDCNDSDPISAGTAGAWFYDGDGDSYGDTSVILITCTPPSGDWTQTAGDCDDFDVAVNPGETETCNGLDDDCVGGVDDGLTSRYLFPDDDDDNFGTAVGALETCLASIPGFALSSGDCADGNPLIFPTQIEACNELDDDCDGAVDEAPAVKPAWRPDLDGDGEASSSAAPFSSCFAPVGYIIDATPTDCDDLDPRVKPGATEICDGVDQDCDGTADDGLSLTWVPDFDADTHGALGAATVSSCVQPAGYIVDATPTDCNDLDASIKPGATEVCNGKDDNCAGGIDEGLSQTWVPDFDADGDGAEGGSAITTCLQPPGFIVDASPDDCDDLDPDRYGGATEVCNDLDDDCDGAADDGVTVPDWRPDADGDGAKDPTKTVVTACDAPGGYVPDDAPDDCDDGDASIYSGAPEQCNATDDDCDGQIDESVTCGPNAYRWVDPSDDLHVFQFVDEDVRWSQAAATCDAWGYHLVWVNSAAEDADIAEQSLLFLTWDHGGSFDGARFWLGYAFDACGTAQWRRYAGGTCVGPAPLTGFENGRIVPLTGDLAFAEVDETTTVIDYDATTDREDNHRFICEAP